MKKYTYNEIFEEVRKVVPSSMQIYLVGGAVRDMLLGKQINDYDFVIEGLVRPVGKKLADNLKGKYYVLDDDRDMVRVLLRYSDKEKPICIDIAQLHGESLEKDLFGRDFSINAIAVDFLKNNRFIDPMGGATDLREKRLRMCNLRSLKDDPLRGMRAIRMAVEFGLEMDSQLSAELHAIRPLLKKASIERYRDEFFKILSLGKAVLSVQLLEKFGFLDYILPSVDPYNFDLLIEAVRRIEHFLAILTLPFDEAITSNLVSGLAVLKLGSFRDQLSAFYDLNSQIPHNRRDLVLYTVIACMKSGLTEKSKLEKQLKVYGKQLLLSTNEINISSGMVGATLDIKKLFSQESISNYQIHRYFHKRRTAGIDGLMLFLAESGCVIQENCDPAEWNALLDRIARFLDSWFNCYSEIIDPKPLLSGNEIRAFLQIPESPLIGKIKNAILEAQINNQITTVEEAQALAGSLNI